MEKGHGGRSTVSLSLPGFCKLGQVTWNLEAPIGAAEGSIKWDGILL